MFEILLQSASYVINASGFYPAMGMTAMTSIFIGAAIYNGELKQATKGMITVGSYAALLLMTNLPRIFDKLSDISTQEHNAMAYAGSVTIFFLTIWYLLGMIIGVYTVQQARKHK
jgi:hypothetical protein